jgi:putative ABC transport system permease protein
MPTILRDARFAARLLAKSPGFTAVAVVALALGVGANTAVFSVVYGVLLKPLPYQEPDRLVAIYDTQPDCQTCPASFPKYVDWRDQNRVFESIGGSVPVPAIMTGFGEPERIPAAQTTASLFRTLGVSPLIGRRFTEDEDRPGAAKVVILTYGFWSERFARDPRILGRTLILDDVPRTVVGVMPDGFVHRTASVFVPLARLLDERQRGSHFLATYGRLKAGVSVETAKREMIGLGHRLAREHGNDHGIDVQPLARQMVRDAVTPLLVLLGAVTFVLLIACANVANLLLARAAGRRREIAVRTALGATRVRLARQLLTESLLLSLAGAAAGLALAYAAVRAFVVAAPPTIVPRLASIGVDWPVLVFTLAVALATGILFGLAPILHARADRASDVLKEETGRTGGGAASRRAGHALVVVEIALAIVLLAGAGLMAKSLGNLQREDLGFNAERALAFDVALPSARYGDDARLRDFFDRAFAAIGGVPGVQSVGATSHLPLRAYGSNAYFDVEGKTLWKPNEAPLAEVRVVGGDYYRAMGIRLVRGRFFGPQDTDPNHTVVIVNESLARRCWPGEDPIGKRLRIASPGWSEVVGVVGDVRTYSPALEPEFEVAFPLAQGPQGTMTIAVRAKGADPRGVLAGVRRAMAGVDPTQPLSKLETIDEVVSQSLSRPRLLSVLIASFAGLAAVLALVGVYGLMACAVSQQTRELGIRMAMGAAPSVVIRMVLGRGLALSAVGITIGLGCALALTRFMQAILYEVSPADPVALGSACAGVLAAALAASYVPARAAARLNPIQTLR